ncbi:MAG: hypothetical protein ACYS8L_10480 [Planctomycetota bacterium]|jgi:hypothetical protein
MAKGSDIVGPDRQGENPLARVAVGAGAAIVAGGVAALVLIGVGLSLLIAGLVVLAVMLVAGAMAPLVTAASRHAGRQLAEGGERQVLDVKASVKALPEDLTSDRDRKVKDVLGRVESGEISPDEALDELD